MAWACRRTGESTFERGVQAGRHFQRTNVGDQANHGEEKGETTGGNERRRPVVRARLNLPASQVGRGVVHVGGGAAQDMYVVPAKGRAARWRLTSPLLTGTSAAAFPLEVGCGARGVRRAALQQNPYGRALARPRAHALRPGAYRTVTSLLWLGWVAGGGGEGGVRARRTHVVARHPHHHAHSAPRSTDVAGRGTWPQ